MTLIESIFAAAITSTTVLGLFVFIAKKSLESMLTKRELSLSEGLKQNTLLFVQKLEEGRPARDFIVKNEIGIYPEMSELVHRLYVMVRDGFNEPYAYKWDPAFFPMTRHYTDNLFRYGFFLPEDVFGELHQYKDLLKEIADSIELCQTDKNLFDQNFYANTIVSKKELSLETVRVGKNIIKNIKLQIKKWDVDND